MIRSRPPPQNSRPLLQAASDAPPIPIVSRKFCLALLRTLRAKRSIVALKLSLRPQKFQPSCETRELLFFASLTFSKLHGRRIRVNLGSARASRAGLGALAETTFFDGSITIKSKAS